MDVRAAEPIPETGVTGAGPRQQGSYGGLFLFVSSHEPGRVSSIQWKKGSVPFFWDIIS